MYCILKGLYMVDHACKFINSMMSTTALVPDAIRKYGIQFPDLAGEAFEKAHPGAYNKAFHPFFTNKGVKKVKIPPEVAAEKKRREQHAISIQVTIAEYYSIIGFSLMTHTLPSGEEYKVCARWNGNKQPSTSAVLPHLFK